MKPPLRIEVSVASQQLRILRGNRVLRTYPVSTSANGTGFAEGSYKTPTGHFVVAEKIGAQMPVFTVFKARQPVGTWSPDQPCDDDLILTRILRLKGLDPENANTWDRYIYIHGTNHEDKIGTPTSHGCIRMRNDDVIDLFDRIPTETPLLIHPEVPPKHHAKTLA
jgi:lipoprotein-anchoring transpeptidase ErfK/SrfK